MRQISTGRQPSANRIAALASTDGAERGAGSFAALGTVIQMSAKETLIWEGDAADDVYQVLRGVACLYKLLPDGRRQVARFCHAGDVIGLTADGHYPYTADALTGLTVVRIRRSDLDTRIETDGALRKTVLHAIGHELSLAQNQLLLLGRKSASERVASFLQSMVEQARRDGGDGRSIALAMTRVDIADFLGLTHETVCRTFSLFRNQGIIAIPDPHLVEVVLPDVLEDIAEGDLPERLCA